MQVQVTSGSAASAIGIIGTGLAMWLPEERWIGALIVLFGILVLIFDVRIDGSHLRIGRPLLARGTTLGTWGPWVLIIGGPLLGLLWLCALPAMSSKKAGEEVRQKEKAELPQITRTAPNRWTWAALTEEEIDALFEKLRGSGPYAFHIACDRPECDALANSFDRLFQRLGWSRTIGSGGFLAQGQVGIFINPGDDPGAEPLKRALESTTAMRVDLGPSRQKEVKDPNTMLVIGTKPPAMASGPLTVPQIAIRFEPRPPYEITEISGQGHTQSTVRIGLKAVGRSFSNCKIYIDKIAPLPPIAGGLPMLLAGGDFLLRYDDPEHLVDVAGHWEHVNQFRFNTPPAWFAEAMNYIADAPSRTIEIKITANNDGVEYQKTVMFELSTDDSKKLHLKRTQ